jgi:hypothetical protein
VQAGGDSAAVGPFAVVPVELFDSVRGAAVALGMRMLDVHEMRERDLVCMCGN